MLSLPYGRDHHLHFSPLLLLNSIIWSHSSLQEAQKRMKIKKAPHILVIHLKRFKYIEQLGRYKKLSYRVVFPMELKLSNTSLGLASSLLYLHSYYFITSMELKRLYEVRTPDFGWFQCTGDNGI